MSAPVEFALLLAGVLGVLVLASVVAGVLRQRVGPGNAVVENLVARTKAWWGMVALLSIAMLFGRAGAVILFGLLSFAAMREFLTLTAKSRADHMALAAAFFVVLPENGILRRFICARSAAAFVVLLTAADAASGVIGPATSAFL